MSSCNEVWKGSAPNTASWMSSICDDALLSAISIPGTHDSAAYTYSVPFLATQRLDVLSQVDAGIRYLDLRCGLRKDILEMVHGPTILGITFEALLAVLYKWLAEHSTEALIIQLKEDREDEKSTKTFVQAVLDVIATHPERWLTNNRTPTLGHARGKIQLLRRFRGDGITAYGINVSRWQDNPLKPFTMRCGHGIRVTVQDHYRYVEPTALPQMVQQKSNEIDEVLRRALHNDDEAHWYISFTSAFEFNWSYRYAPRDVAEGSWYAFKKVQGVNETLSEHLRHVVRRGRCGILAMDFPDQNVIAAILETNISPTDAGTYKLVVVVLIILLIVITSCYAFQQATMLVAYLQSVVTHVIKVI